MKNNEGNTDCNRDSKMSALRRAELLQAALQDLTKAPKQLLRACSHQRLLAALNIEKQRVRPVSLNTLKKAADLAVEGGWERLDRLRRDVLTARTQRDCRGKKSSASNGRKDLRLRLEETAERLEQERRARAILNRAYVDIVGKLQVVAKKDELFASELARHLATFNIPLRFEVVEGKS